MNIIKANTILVPWESYLYLQQKCRNERCGDWKTEKQIERLKRNFEAFSHNGYKQLMDGDLGGCVNGKLTSWKCEDMKRILNEAGLMYKDGGESECIIYSNATIIRKKG